MRRLAGVDGKSDERALEAVQQPGDIGNMPTRQARRAGASTPPPAMKPSSGDAPSRSSAASGSSLELSMEALRNAERRRLRVTLRVLMGATSLCLVLVPLMGGDPFAKRLFMATVAWSLAMMVVLLRSSHVANYNANVVGAGAVSMSVGAVCVLYYFGPLSAAAMFGALGLYAFSLGGSARWAAGVYATIAGGQMLLWSLLSWGAIEDRGLLRTDSLPQLVQVGFQACIQAVYASAFLVARASRASLEGVFGELEVAARRIAQREALLNEAKREIERGVRAGGEGRFTEQVIGSFRLGNVIGRGGMGEVYEAVHVETNEEAAVKLLQRSVFADPQAVVRFAREAQAATALDSPYVVRVLEVPGENAPLPYLAMERLRGEDLASMLRRERKLSTRELMELALQVGGALDAARAAGVIHRDIKPQNLFLARRDNASSLWKVLDFGVSKLVGQGTLTHDQLVGTPEYMAPEQAAGKQVDHRADIYGLTAVLYRCLASSAPFVGESLPALVHKVVHAMPPQPSSFGRVSSDLEAVLAIGLAKDPDERFGSGAELAEALKLAVEGRLTSSLQARAERILARAPWGARGV